MARIALIVNPIAGIGGPVSAKGSDAIPWGELGVYIGPSFKASILFAREFRRYVPEEILKREEIIAPRGLMGEIAAREMGGRPEIICRPKYPSSREDTRKCSARAAEEGADLILFVGGDGTAFDVYEGSGGRVSLLGIPGGTKVYSSVFARSIASAARLLSSYLKGEFLYTTGEIILVDEEELRKAGRFSVSGVYLARTIESLSAVEHQQSKDFHASEEEELRELAECVSEEIPDEQPLIVGPGRTAMAISERLGIEKRDLLSVSAGWRGRTYCSDCSSSDIASFCSLSGGAKTVKVILSPLGSSGFLLGRGNQQIPTSVLREMSLRNLIVVATRSKAFKLKQLYVDLKGSGAEENFVGYVRVKVGCGEELVMRVQRA